MSSTYDAVPRLAGTARQDLRAVLDRGFTLEMQQRRPTAGPPLRRSAVLMLFGAGEGSGSSDLGVLLTLRSEELRHHAGQIAFPGGGLEPVDSGPEAAALREASEEAGIDAHGVEVLGTLPDIPVPVSNNLVTPVLGWWSTPGEVVADLREAAEAYWVPVADLLDPAARGTSVLEFGGAVRRGPAFRLAGELGGRIVWGFTGILLSALFEQAGWTVPWDRSREIVIAR